MKVSAKYVTDKKGKKIEVVLPIKDYKKILDELDELACIREFDKATKRKPDLVSAKDFFHQLEQRRK